MATRHKELARKRREWLREQLGGVCVDCGTTENLTFDCEVPQGDWHHKCSFDQRMFFYLQQHAAGNLRLRCRVHNSEKGATIDKEYHEAARSDQAAAELEANYLASLILEEETV